MGRRFDRAANRVRRPVEPGVKREPAQTGNQAQQDCSDQTAAGREGNYEHDHCEGPGLHTPVGHQSPHHHLTAVTRRSQRASHRNDPRLETIKSGGLGPIQKLSYQAPGIHLDSSRLPVE